MYIKVNDIESFKTKISIKFISHARHMLDLRDFMINTKRVNEKFQNEQYREKLKYNLKDF
ncbi:MAG: hypothetical protein ACFFC3_03205 [Candidatus Odinarchaeota archaeon]